jgi:hypothetical protein
LTPRLQVVVTIVAITAGFRLLAAGAIAVANSRGTRIHPAT